MILQLNFPHFNLLLQIDVKGIELDRIATTRNKKSIIMGNESLPILHDIHDQKCATPHSSPLLWLTQSQISGLASSLHDFHYQGLPAR